MTDLQGVIGLLYRADWTGLSLAADVRSETDQDLLSSRVRAVKPSWVPGGEVLGVRQMSWLRRLGVRCVAVPEWPAGGGAGGEDEVRPVHAPSGCAVDEDRFGLGPGLRVHQHHAALTGAQARVAPGGQDDDYGPEGTAEFCQEVLIAGRVCLVRAPFEQAGADHALEPAGQQAGGDAEVLLELVEARVAVKGVVQDEQGPPLADQAES